MNRTTADQGIERLIREKKGTRRKSNSKVTPPVAGGEGKKGRGGAAKTRIWWSMEA